MGTTSSSTCSSKKSKLAPVPNSSKPLWILEAQGPLVEFSLLPPIEGQSALVVPLKAYVCPRGKPGTEVREMTPRDSFWSQLHSVRKGFLKLPRMGALLCCVWTPNPGLAPPEDVCNFYEPDRYRPLRFDKDVIRRKSNVANVARKKPASSSLIWGIVMF
jgi:hypothetical protein